jgi:tetratricopeptide (TPR) repeat protein
MGRGALRQRRVAVKVLRVGAGDASADEIRRFTREAHLAAAIALAALAVTPATGDRAARRGEAVAQAGEYERAIEVFDQALCENPAHAGARARRAESLQRVLGGAAQEVEERGAALDRARQDLDVARPAMQEATLRTEAMLRGRAAEAAKAVESAEAALRQARERLKAPTDSGAR